MNIELLMNISRSLQRNQFDSISVAMENTSSQQSASSPTASGTSMYLSNLPSRGLFSSSVLSSNLGGMRVYVCDHETSPPEDQQIKTNSINIFIRSLRKQKSESGLKDTKEGSSKKRGAEKALDRRPKRAITLTGSEGSSNGSPGKKFQNLTVEKLRALLKEKGLSPKGKKDELIARLRSD